MRRWRVLCRGYLRAFWRVMRGCRRALFEWRLWELRRPGPALLRGGSHPRDLYSRRSHLQRCRYLRALWRSGRCLLRGQQLYERLLLGGAMHRQHGQLYQRSSRCGFRAGRPYGDRRHHGNRRCDQNRRCGDRRCKDRWHHGNRRRRNRRRDGDGRRGGWWRRSLPRDCVQLTPIRNLFRYDHTADFRIHRDVQRWGVHLRASRPTVRHRSVLRRQPCHLRSAELRGARGDVRSERHRGLLCFE